MNDDIRSLLRCWNPEVSSSRAFRRNVWSRIEADGARQSGGARWVVAVFSQISRPHVGAAMLAVALLGGIWVGALTSADGREEYLRSVNPYLLARSPQ